MPRINLFNEPLSNREPESGSWINDSLISQGTIPFYDDINLRKVSENLCFPHVSRTFLKQKHYLHYSCNGV